MAIKSKQKKISTGRTSAQKLAIAVVMGVVVVTCFLVLVLPSPRQDPTELLELSRQALRRGELESSINLALSVEKGDEQFAESRLLIGEAFTRAGDLDSALRFYQEVPESSGDWFQTALYSRAELHRTACQWQKAIELYSKVLEKDLHQNDCRERLTFTLGACGGRWQCVPHLMELLKQKQWSVESLAILADVERPIEQLDLVQFCEQAQPADPYVQLAIAVHMVIDGKLDLARTKLEAITKSHPDLLLASEHLGETLLGLNDYPALKLWNDSLPKQAELSPTVWYVRGQMAKAAGNLELAAGCLAKTLEITPEHRQACYQLGQVLAKLSDPIAESVIRRAELQLEMSQQLDKILSSQGADVQAMKLVTEGCQSLGRHWEAWAWSQTAIKLHTSPAWANAVLTEASAKIINSPLRTIRDQTPAVVFKLQKWSSYASEEDVRKLQFQSNGSSNVVAKQLRQGQFRFEQVTKSGIDFSYFNGADPATDGVRMFEQTGGGVGVIDYDCDGWPDIYFTQGAKWITGEQQPTPSAEYVDKLFRNKSGEVFEDVAAKAGIDEQGFGQGLAVGDLNNDGFEDLLVGLIGQNRLFINNGDGTFSENTDALSGQRNSWTTSLAIADLNHDGLSDIYRVCYVQGKDVYTLICNGKGCSPKVFDGSPNQCWLNDGQGGYTLVERADGESQLSKGLGVLIFRIESEEFPSLFIANDQVRNFLLVVRALSAQSIELVDEALVRGLALSLDGLAFACMGVAADDVDNNGTIDLLVTNFADEPNTLYLQDSTGLFSDSTAGSGMQSASYPYVGWGTQLIDVDRDSWVDAVVVNGPVDDYTDQGKGYAMAPQAFRNQGGGRFELLPPSTAGDFFALQFLGRGMAKLDWNRDGLFEFAVSTMNSPAQLVKNVSVDAGNYSTFRLVGTQSARIPIGATISVRSADKVWKKQLTAGDGYQCSNEHSIQFGLGAVDNIEQVSVQWPSGIVNTYNNIPINSVTTLVEGSEQPTVMVR
ncbi:MAG: FG-GAP-like repeat-containing protein [Pirellulales bacterium]